MTAALVDLADVGREIVAAFDAIPRFARAVRRGRYIEPPVVPFVAVAPVAVSSTQAGAAALGEWYREVVYDVQAWVAPEKLDDADHEVELAELVAHELTKAIEDRRSAPSSVLRRLPKLEVSARGLIAGVDPIAANTVSVFLAIELAYSRRSGLMGVPT